ncbi:MAG TPA: methyltransferase domain-containing protein [Allosphingosinicella sp.]|jgi:SAM-dependent methyltransferase
MLKSLIRRGVRSLGYDILKVPRAAPLSTATSPPPIEPIWPLPRAGRATSDAWLRDAFAAFPHWHYAYAFEDGLTFSTAHVNPGPETDDPVRPLQRFRHFIPQLVAAAGGSLRGKRVLDMACNSGFWSIQCALMGAEVVGFDARPELVAQANLLKEATRAASAEFRRLDFADASAATLGGTFDIVLNLGLLYHLPEPLSALERTVRLSHGHVLLDTGIHPADDHLVYLKWEEPFDIRMAASQGIVAVPTGRAIDLMLRHLGVRSSLRVPVRSADIPDVYRTERRASWLIEV